MSAAAGAWQWDVCNKVRRKTCTGIIQHMWLLKRQKHCNAHLHLQHKGYSSKEEVLNVLWFVWWQAAHPLNCVCLHTHTAHPHCHKEEDHLALWFPPWKTFTGDAGSPRALFWAGFSFCVCHLQSKSTWARTWGFLGNQPIERQHNGDTNYPQYSMLRRHQLHGFVCVSPRVWECLVDLHVWVCKGLKCVCVCVHAFFHYVILCRPTSMCTFLSLFLWYLMFPFLLSHLAIL